MTSVHARLGTRSLDSAASLAESKRSPPRIFGALAGACIVLSALVSCSSSGKATAPPSGPASVTKPDKAIGLLLANDWRIVQIQTTGSGVTTFSNQRTAPTVHFSLTDVTIDGCASAQLSIRRGSIRVTSVFVILTSLCRPAPSPAVARLVAGKLFHGALQWRLVGGNLVIANPSIATATLVALH